MKEVQEVPSKAPIRKEKKKQNTHKKNPTTKKTVQQVVSVEELSALKQRAPCTSQTCLNQP